MIIWVILLSVATLGMNVAGLFGAKVMFNKHSFPFPCTLPFLTSMFVFGILLIYRNFLREGAEEKHYKKNPVFWMYMFFFGLSVGLTTGFSALSISAQDISMKEIIEASQPLFTLSTFIFYEKKSVSAIQIIGICLTVSGVLCSVMETPGIAIDGAIYSIIIVASNAFVSSLSSKIKLKYPFLDNLKLMMYSSTFFLATTFIIALPEGNEFSLYAFQNPGSTLYFILASGATMLIYQYLNLKLIELSSSLFASMVYSLKIIMVIIFSVIFFEKSVPNWEKIVGMCITAAGFFIYSYTFLENTAPV